MSKYYFNLSLSKNKTQSQRKFYKKQAKGFGA